MQAEPRDESRVGGDPELLVFDASEEGHRRNYVRLIAGLTGGQPTIGPVRGAIGKLVATRKLILTTFETAPAAFASVLMVRALLGRRSAVIFLRAHLYRRGRPLKRIGQRLVFKILNRLRSVLLLTVVPVEMDGSPSRFNLIADPESWDVADAARVPPQSELSRSVRHQARDRQILLFTGYVEQSRGIGFLQDVLAGAPELTSRFLPVVAGKVLPDAVVATQCLEKLGAVVVDRFITDDEMLSLFGIADAVWCCFAPERDMTSGVFGRAVQFGAAPIVRHGSILSGLAVFPNAIRLDFGDVAQACTAMAPGFERMMPPDAELREDRERLRRLLLDHLV